MRRAARLSLAFLFLISMAGVVRAQIPVPTEHYDLGRTGANLNETTLNTSNVNVNQFGLIYSYTVDGSVYAQPLYVPNLTIPGMGTHNVLFVATMNDVIYAFDADSNTGATRGILWSVDFRNPTAGVTAIPITDIVGANNLNIVGNVGIESTPYIDLSSNTIYLVARTMEVSGSTTNYVARLHALDITTGNEKFGGPTVISGSVPGSGGTLVFDPQIHNQRSSLAMANGMILFSWASHEDMFTWHGWVMAYSATSLQQVGIYCTTPFGGGGGSWMAGRGPAVDASGNVYYVSGNGDWNGESNLADSIIKFTTSGGVLSQTDYFTPDDYANLQSDDLDLGSSGPMLIPNTNLLISGGKQGGLYLVSQLNLGHEASGNTQIVQTLPTGGGGGYITGGGPVYWNRTTGAGPTMYAWADGSSSYLSAYHFNGNTFDAAPISQSTFPAASGYATGGTMTVSANGSTAGTGIVWASMATGDADHGTSPGVLRAFDANDLTSELWDTTQNATRDNPGIYAKFVPPTVVNGKVYLASFSNVVNVYGLLTLAPNFGITGSPNVQSIPPGGTTTYTLSTTQLGGFSGSIGLSVSGLPSGATASFSPSSIGAPGSSTMTVATTTGTPVGTYTLSVAGASGALSNSTTVFLNVATSGQSSGVISIDFVGEDVSMAPSEVAGVIAKPNWNNAVGASGTIPLALSDETGTSTSATVTWQSNNVWELPITDQPGNARMMKGYLDTSSSSATTVVVSGIPLNPAGYNVFVYVDGDNGSATRIGNYQISGAGITTTTISATDNATDFSGTFTQSNNSIGNYVVFPINATGFTLTATAGAASDSTPRAPVNGIQIVPLGQQSNNPDFGVSASPSSGSVAQGQSIPFTVNTTALFGFNGTVNLAVAGLPSGATGIFSVPAIIAGGSSVLTVGASTTTPIGVSTLTITATSGTLTHTVTLTLTVTAAVSSGNPMAVKFVGTGAPMGNTEVAGVVPQANWTQATGGTPASPLMIIDQTGANSGATVTWSSDSLYNLPIVDQSGNTRMMRGYLDDRLGGPTTVTVAGLPSISNGYNVYVYADGSNGSATRTGNYKISGSGITTTTISLTDLANTDFSGAFTPANNSNGNYVVFTINATGFTVTATPGAASDGTPRAPLNAVQIVPLGPPTPDFSLAASPSTASVVQGASATYPITTSALSGFTGTIALTASGLPTGTTAIFNPASVTGSQGATLTVTTSSTTPLGSSTFTLTGTSGSLTHSATLTLTVAAPPDFSISATPSSYTVNPGGSATYTVNASALNGFTGTISLSAAGLPLGATVSFNPASITPGISSVLTVSTTSGTPLGSSTLTVTGTDSPLTHATTVSLVVSANPDFSISASPASSSVAQGTSAPYSVGVAGLNGFSGTVGLSVTGLPAGATSSFSPTSIGAGASSTMTIATAVNTPVGTSTLTITGTSGSLSHTTTVILTVTIGVGGGTRTISVHFVGEGNTMAAGEAAGVVPKSNWNQASGAIGSTNLVDETGNSTGASVSWNGAGIWQLPITDQPGNARMMEGYLDTTSSSVTTVTFSGLPSATYGYNVYVYADGDNGSATRSAIYQISGTGITTTSIGLTDPPNTNFSGTFTPANNSNGNYVVFLANATSFMISATPGTASDGTPRAPLNGIQIVPAGPPAPDFTLTATPASASVAQGANSATYTVSAAALNGFSGSITLAASGLPTGATASFCSPTIPTGSNCSLIITTSASTPVGSSTLAITGTSGSLIHTAAVVFTVTPTGASANAISIKFVGTGTAMGNTEIAGVVPASYWNNLNWFTGTASRLLNGSGTTTTAAVTWTADGQYALPITDQAGNFRMMRGYLDNSSGKATTVTVSGLPADSNGYTVYVYADGGNGSATRTGAYQISGTGITTTSINLTDAANTNFSGTFTQANNSNGNYVMFTITANGFKLTATPGTASDGTKRAPVNAIQIVPR